MLIVKSKLHEGLSAFGVRHSKDFADVLSKKVEEVLLMSAERAKSNGRSTIKPYDL